MKVQFASRWAMDRLTEISIMKNFFKINSALLVLIFSSLCVFGQSDREIENELVGLIKEIQKYSNYGQNYDDEKLYKANEVFEEKLLAYTKKTSTLKYGFSKLGELMIITESADGKLRAYSWDQETGGTMHDYSVVYQYAGADGKVRSRTSKTSSDLEDDGPGSFVNKIYSVANKEADLYVICTTFIGSTSDHYASANLFRISGDKLVDKVKMFKTKQGLTDSISFEYDFFSVVDRPERPLRLIEFDGTTQTLKIPVVIADQKWQLGRVTNRFIKYKFDGKYFVKVR